MEKVEVKYNFVLCDCPDCGSPEGIHSLELGMTGNGWDPPIATCRVCGKQWAVGMQLLPVSEVWA